MVFSGFSDDTFALLGELTRSDDPAYVAIGVRHHGAKFQKTHPEPDHEYERDEEQSADRPSGTPEPNPDAHVLALAST